VTEEQLSSLVHRFYGKVREDAVLGPVFNHAISDWPHHLGKMVDFWSSVMLTSGRYKGNPLAVHMRQPIRPEFFDRWLALFGETADEVVGGERAALFRTKTNRIAESLKLALFFRPENRPPQPHGPARAAGGPDQRACAERG
jgi:hemoglobin